MLFVLALAAIYRIKDWRGLLWVVTAFTIGHSLTLALAVTNVMTLPPYLIEFLIPVTILATCVQNLFVHDAQRNTVTTRPGYRFAMAAFFGLIHGAGFANYLRSLFLENIFTPLLGFNIGLEIGQLFVLLVALSVFAVIDWMLSRQSLFKFEAASMLRGRLVSVVVGVVAAVWSIQRFPRGL